MNSNVSTSLSSTDGVGGMEQAAVSVSVDSVTVSPQISYCRGTLAQAGGGRFQYINEEHLVFSCGKYAVRSDDEMKDVTWLNPNIGSGFKTGTIRVSPGQRYVAVAEVAGSAADATQIVLFSTKTQKQVRAVLVPMPYVNVRDMAFSGDSKLLIVLCAGRAVDDPTCLFAFSLDKSKLLASLPSLASSCMRLSASGSKDSCEIVVSGPEPGSVLCLGFGRNDTEDFRIFQPPLSIPTSVTVVGHAFFQPTPQHEPLLLIAVHAGKFILYKERERVGQILLPTTTAANGTSNPVLTCCAVFAKGVLIGTQNGLVYIFERSSDVEWFEHYKTFGLRYAEAIVEISVSPNCENFILTTTSNQTFKFPLSNVEILGEAGTSVIDVGIGSSSNNNSNNNNSNNNNSNSVGSSIPTAVGLVDQVSCFIPLDLTLHGAAISDIDVAVQRPFVLSCSASEHGVRLFNFVSRHIVLRKTFPADEPLTCAISPTGLKAVVGFATKTVVFDVLEDDLVVSHELQLRNARKVRFCTGGQCFSVLSGNSLLIFSAVTFELAYHFRGHAGNVKASAWADPFDIRCVSAGYEGTIYEWSTVHNRRIENSDVHSKFCEYYDVCYAKVDAQALSFLQSSVGQAAAVISSGGVGLAAGRPSASSQGVGAASGNTSVATNLLPNQHVILAVGSDGLLKWIYDGVVLRAISTGRKDLQFLRVAFIASCNHVAVGCSDGSVRFYSLLWVPSSSITGQTGAASAAAGQTEPGNVFQQPQSQPQFPVHYDVPFVEVHLHGLSAISGMCLSADERFLFTAGVDGSLFVAELDIFQSGRPMARKMFDYNVFMKTVLIDSETLQEKTNSIAHLKEELEHREMDSQIRLQSMEANYEDQLMALRRDLKHAVASLEGQLSESQVKSLSENEALQAELRKMSRQYAATTEDLVSTYERRLRGLAQRLRELEEEKEDQRVMLEDRQRVLDQAHQAELQQLQTRARGQLDAAQEELQLQRRDYDNMRQEYDVVLSQEREEFEGELQTVKSDMNAAVVKEQESASSLRTQALVAKRKAESFKEEIDRSRSEREQRDRTIAMLRDDVQERDKRIRQLQSEIDLRDKTIVTKEKRIFELKRSVGELDKLRFVLGYKFQELKQEAAPKEEQIAKLADRIVEMDRDIERLGSDRESLKSQLDQKAAKVDTLLRDIARVRTTSESHRNAMDAMRRQLLVILNPESSQSSNKILTQARKLVEETAAQSSESDEVHLQEKQKAAARNRTIFGEVERQRTHLEQRLLDMRQQAVKVAARNTGELERRTRENATLLKEVNDLRHEKRQLQNKMQTLQVQLQNLQRTGGAAPLADPITGDGSGSKAAAGAGPAGPHSNLSARGSDPHAPLKRGNIAEMLRVIDSNNSEILRQRDEIALLKDQALSLAMVPPVIGGGGTGAPASLAGIDKHDRMIMLPVPAQRLASASSGSGNSAMASGSFLPPAVSHTRAMSLRPGSK